MITLTQAQRIYDAQLPPDPEEEAEREARRKARDDKKIEEFAAGERRGSR